MLLHKRRRSTFTIRASVITTLALAAWFHPLDASGMGHYQRIDGLVESTGYNWSVRKCVRNGIERTGLGVEAISYAGVHFTCEMFYQVDDVSSNVDWCSQWVFPGSPDECLYPPVGPGSPILLDLDRNQFHLSGGPVDFDIDADGQLESITWVSPGTQDAFLFLDRNGNGIVDDGSELFGNGTSLFSGEQAGHGYEALAEFDLIENGGNQDGLIDDADSIFSDLKVWIDSNANGVHEHLESQSLVEAGVLSLRLDYRRSSRTDSHGNEFRYISQGLIEVDGRSRNMWTTDVFFKILVE